MRGAELMGFSVSDSPLTALTREDVLIVADHPLGTSDLTHASRAAAVIVIGTTLPAGLANAAAVLPIANMAEEEGTFTNLRGRVRALCKRRRPRAITAKLSSWRICSRAGRAPDYYTARAYSARWRHRPATLRSVIDRLDFAVFSC